MPEYFKVILEYGLYQDPTGRQLSFLHVRDLLLAAPKDAQGYIKSHLRHLHSNEPQGGSHAPSAPPRDTTNHPTHTSRTVDQALRDRAGNQEKERGGQYRQETGKDSGQYRQETRKHRQHERKSCGERTERDSARVDRAVEDMAPQTPGKLANTRTTTTTTVIAHQQSHA
ncbi:hypothetical protein MAR_028895, partial [Mya arenaria]